MRIVFMGVDSSKMVREHQVIRIILPERSGFLKRQFAKTCALIAEKFDASHQRNSATNWPTLAAHFAAPGPRSRPAMRYHNLAETKVALRQFPERRKSTSRQANFTLPATQSMAGTGQPPDGRAVPMSSAMGCPRTSRRIPG
jgi:hypothetical protein